MFTFSVQWHIFISNHSTWTVLLFVNVDFELHFYSLFCHFQLFYNWFSTLHQYMMTLLSILNSIMENKHARCGSSCMCSCCSSCASASKSSSDGFEIIDHYRVSTTFVLILTNTIAWRASYISLNVKENEQFSAYSFNNNTSFQSLDPHYHYVR